MSFDPAADAGTRVPAPQPPEPLPGPVPGPPSPPRESSPVGVLRTLLPVGSTPFERLTGLYLFLMALTCSVPLWAHSLWTVWRGHSYTERRAVTEADVPPRLVALQPVAVGLMFMAILALRSRTTLDVIYFQF